MYAHFTGFQVTMRQRRRSHFMERFDTLAYAQKQFQHLLFAEEFLNFCPLYKMLVQRTITIVRQHHHCLASLIDDNVGRAIDGKINDSYHILVSYFVGEFDFTQRHFLIVYTVTRYPFDGIPLFGDNVFGQIYDAEATEASTRDGPQSRKMLDMAKLCSYIYEPSSYPWPMCSFITYLVSFMIIVSLVHRHPILKIIAQPMLFILCLPPQFAYIYCRYL